LRFSIHEFQWEEEENKTFKDRGEAPAAADAAEGLEK